MPSPAKRCISGLKSTVPLRLLLDRVGLAVPVLPFGLGRLVVPFRGQCGGRCAQPVVPWCRLVVAPSSLGLVCVAGVPGSLVGGWARRVSVPGLMGGVGVRGGGCGGFMVGGGGGWGVGWVWSSRVIVVAGMRAPPAFRRSPCVVDSWFGCRAGVAAGRGLGGRALGGGVRPGAEG